MPVRSRASVIVAIVCVALLCAIASSRAASPDRRAGLAKLQGTWVLDPERTPEDVDPYKQGGSSSKRRPIFGPGPSGPLTGPGMGGPMTGRHADPDPEDISRLRHLADVAFDDADDLEIAVDGDAVTISAGSHVQRLRANGSKQLETTSLGLELERKTKWDDGKLVTEFKVRGGGGKGKQIWTPEGSSLVVATEIETDHSPGPLKMRRVYDREVSSEP